MHSCKLLFSTFFSGASGSGWTAGLVVSNLGSKLSYDNDASARYDQPANLGLGVGYTGVADEDNRWMLSVEGNKLLVDSSAEVFSNSAYKIAAGGEYSYKGQFWLRAGYNWGTVAAGGLRYFTAGVGVKYSVMGIDFSYLAPSGNSVTRSPLSNTFRLGLSFSFSRRGN